MKNRIILILFIIFSFKSIYAQDVISDIIKNGNISHLDNLLDVNKMEYYTQTDLRILRNIIFAKHGYSFTYNDLTEHFSKFDWYEENDDNTDAVKKLTTIDWINIELIKELENEFISSFYETEKKDAPDEFHFWIGSQGVTITSYNYNSRTIEIPAQIQGLPVTAILSGVFRNSSYRLVSVTIPDSVTYIEDYAFNYCQNLMEIIVSPDNTKYSSIDGVLYDKEQTTLIYYPSKKEGHFTIPDGVIRIEKRAFAESIYLTGIAIPNTVTSIGNSAFEYCNALESIILPDSVTSIGRYAFENCFSLSSVKISNGVTTIGERAFAKNINLKNIIIPDSVRSIGKETFEGCISLESIKLSKNIKTIEYGTFFNTGLKTLTIPYNVAVINDHFIDDCPDLVSVTFKRSDISIGYWAHLNKHLIWAYESGGKGTYVRKKDSQEWTKLSFYFSPLWLCIVIAAGIIAIAGVLVRRRK